MSCEVGKATEGLENELWRSWSDRKIEEWAVIWCPLVNISSGCFSFPPTPKIKGSSHKKKLNISILSENDLKRFNKTFWVYITFETQQQDTIDFSRKNPWN